LVDREIWSTEKFGRLTRQFSCVDGSDDVFAAGASLVQPEVEIAAPENVAEKLAVYFYYCHFISFDY
jgi:hypothetical protein